jgi:hypothetical protein
MFERHKEKKEEAHYEDELKEWSSQLEELQALLALAKGASIGDSQLILKKGEVAVATVTNVGLIEERRGAGQWQGGSQGVSFPIGSIGGRSVRYRVGATRGHYVQGEPHPTAVDHGVMTVTNQRIVYLGASKTSECTFQKLLGIQHSPGGITISVSNRQKPTVIFFGDSLDDWVTNRLSIALALFNGDEAAVQRQLQTQIQEMEDKKPEPPLDFHPLR